MSTKPTTWQLVKRWRWTITLVLLLVFVLIPSVVFATITWFRIIRMVWQ